jgi:hypothetical protein
MFLNVPSCWLKKEAISGTHPGTQPINKDEVLYGFPRAYGVIGRQSDLSMLSSI